MGELETKTVLRGAAAILSVIAVLWLALWYFVPAPPTQITMTAGVKGGAFDHLAELYREKLAAHHVTLNLRYYEVGNENVRLIDDPKSGVSAAFMFTGQTNGEESPDILSLGRIDNAPLWIFYCGASPIERLTQLKGKRLNISPAIGKLVAELLAAHGVDASNTTFSTLLLPQAMKSLRAGEVDVIFPPPVALNNPAIQSLLHDPTVRLMNVAQAEGLARLFPTLHRLVLPQGVIDLQANVPAADVNLLALSNVVVVRKELHPEMIYLLAQTMKEVHGGAGVFQNVNDFPSINDPEFPVAEEAIDYYKNGPSFLQRYLPFWMINYAKRAAAILVAVIAVVIPLFTYAPKIYQWFLRARLMKLYRRMRDIEAELDAQLTARQVETLQANLESVYQAARILPMRHSDLFISVMTHIRLLRMELASRATATRG